LKFSWINTINSIYKWNIISWNYPNSKIVRLYDIIVNGIFCIYINKVTQNQPYIFITSFFTTLVFMFNTKYFNSSYIHVLCIQWVLLQLYIDS
jgi:hypothetical protein